MSRLASGMSIASTIALQMRSRKKLLYKETRNEIPFEYGGGLDGTVGDPRSCC